MLADIGPEPGSLPDDQHRPIAAAWSLSFQLAEELLPPETATRLIVVLSVLDPNGIPVEALLADPVRDFVGGPALPDYLAMLRRLSLVDEQASDGLVRIHALVQRAARERSSSALVSAAIAVAADGLLAAWPDDDTGDADLKMTMYANTVALRTAGEPVLWRGGAHPAILRACGVLQDVGLRDAAGSYLREALPLALAHLGPDHPDTLKIRHWLAGWLGQSDPAKAVREHEPVLADRTRVLGNDHEDTLVTRNNMLFWQGKAGDVVGAVAGFEALVADSSRAVGQTHEATLAARNNLAHWLTKIGRIDEARSVATALVADSARSFGEQSPSRYAIGTCSH